MKTDKVRKYYVYIRGLKADAVHHIIHGKISLLRLDLTVEHDLEQDIPELLTEIFRIPAIDRLQHLRTFLHEMLF